MNKNNITQTLPDEILLKYISFSPFNHRWGNRPVIEEPIVELAESIKTHGVIQRVLVRPLPNGKYEMVVGERRCRASELAGKISIPATIRELTDEQVQEIQLIENFQREDPHPMAEAMGFKKLLDLNKKKNNVPELAARIGKSVAYVYQRMKLNDLSEDFREMFFSNKLKMTEALRLCRLDEKSQNEFYDEHCEDWENDEWTFEDFVWQVANYQMDLSDAPFDIKDAKLDKKAGACTKCPNNTAATQSLFPEESDEARCTNRVCYDNKCQLFRHFQIVSVLQTYPELPVTIPSDFSREQIIASHDPLLAGRKMIMQDEDYGSWEDLPDMPLIQDYQYLDTDEEKEERLKCKNRNHRAVNTGNHVTG